MTNIPNTLQAALRYHRAGRAREAGERYRRVLDVDPHCADALHLLGMLAFDRRQHDKAADLIRRAIQSNGLRADFHNNLGNVLQEQESYAEAIASYRRALDLQPDYVAASHNLGNAHRALEDWDEAESCYRRAGELCDDSPDIHNSLGLVLRAQGRLEEAAVSCRRAIQLDDSYAPAHNNLGLMLADQGRLDEAAECYKRAAGCESRFAEPHHNLGIVLERQGQHDEALDSYQRAIDLRPSYAEARFNRSLIWLMQGNLRRGWSEYEWRGREHGNPQHPEAIKWNGTSLARRTVLIESEQGVGDEIMFASCYREIIDQAAKCYLQCDERLVELFSRSFPAARVVARPSGGERAARLPHGIDLVLRAGSLPLVLRPSLDSFPRHRGYLVPDAGRLEQWARRHDALGPAMKIGISWRGGAAPLARKAKSTRLDDWAPLAALGERVHWVNLQYGDCRAELEEARRRHNLVIHDWPDAEPRSDLDDFAARVAALDLVVSVSNTTVHVAGALAVPVWTLVPDPPPWRWMLEREDSPWYPSMRLLRQSRPGCWSDVLAQVVRSLRRRCSSHHTRSVRVDQIHQALAQSFMPSIKSPSLTP